MPFINGKEVVIHAEEVEAIKQQVNLLQKSEGSKKNILSSLNVLQKHGILDRDNIIDSLLYDFDSIRDDAREYCNTTGKNRSMLSHLNDLKMAASSSCVIDLEKLSLSDALHHIGTRLSPKARITKHKAAHLIHKLAKDNDINVSRQCIYAWIYNNNKPRCNKNTIELLKLLDKVLGCDGKLISKLDIVIRRSTTKRETYPSVKLPEDTINQLNDYCLFKSQGQTPLIPVVFKNDSVILKAFRRTPKGSRSWSLDINGHSQSAVTFRSTFQSYANFIEHYSKTRKIDIKIDITVLFNIELLNEYINDCIRRDVFTSPLGLCKNIKSESNWKSYLSRYHATTSCIKEWKDEIIDIHENLEDNIYQLNSMKSLDLDGKRNVDFILNSKDPENMVKTIQRELDKLINLNSPGSKHSWSKQRSAFIFKVSTLGMCPLRIKNFLHMKWAGELPSTKAENSTECCMYYNIDNDCYSIFIPKKALKNRKRRNITAIHRDLPHEFNSYIKNMLELRALFLDTESGKKAVEKFGRDSLLLLNPAYTTSTLSTHTLKVIQKIWPELYIENGINPHSLRHLTASLYLKHHPECYSDLATLLNDKLETVINVYAKVDDNANSVKLMQFGTSIFGEQ